MRQITKISDGFTPGSFVRLVVATDGIPSGDRGVVLGHYTDDDSVVVSFKDGARRVPSSHLVKATASTAVAFDELSAA